MSEENQEGSPTREPVASNEEQPPPTARQGAAGDVLSEEAKSGPRSGLTGWISGLLSGRKNRT